MNYHWPPGVRPVFTGRRISGGAAANRLNSGSNGIESDFHPRRELSNAGSRFKAACRVRETFPARAAGGVGVGGLGASANETATPVRRRQR